MSFDELLTLYDTSSTEAIGFADDLCLLQAGIDLGTVMGQAQFSINKAVRWATDRGLTFCPKKTAMLLFTKKKQSSYKINKHLTLYGNVITPTRDVKYLCVWIDNKLNFNKHLNEKIKSAKRLLAMTRSTIRKAWGPSPKASQWLWTGVIRPAITYAAVVWYPRISKYQTNLDKLAQVQRLGILNIANVRGGTPTTALEVAYGVEPLDLHLCEVATRTYLRIGQPQGSNQ
jgi:uncharacterized membrane protein YkvA (DUF1232 family)